MKLWCLGPIAVNQGTGVSSENNDTFTCVIYYVDLTTCGTEYLRSDYWKQYC